MTNLLLLLSAMLSALVGSGPVSRAQHVPVAVAIIAQDQVVAAPLRGTSARPLTALPALVAVLGLGVIAWPRVPAVVPAWKTRRRE